MRRAPAGPERLLFLASDVARVVLVDVELPVEAEELGVRVEEALDVGLRGQHLELLLLERAKVFRTDLGRPLDVRELEALAEPGFPKAVADFEHASTIVEPIRRLA
jgi:hypothetical protein